MVEFSLLRYYSEMTTMKIFGLLVLLAPTGEALASPGAALRLRTPLRTAPATMQIFGKKKEKIPTLEERGYWAGEWVCADCGYIYEPDPKDPFEELPPYWKCPQCAGPRRRFIKKAGDVLGKLDDTCAASRPPSTAAPAPPPPPASPPPPARRSSTPPERRRDCHRPPAPPAMALRTARLAAFHPSLLPSPGR